MYVHYASVTVWAAAVKWRPAGTPAPPFREVGTLLKEKYENAAKVQVYEALCSVHAFYIFIISLHLKTLDTYNNLNLWILPHCIKVRDGTCLDSLSY